MKPPKHIVSVSAYIENHQGEVLLIRTQQRDTWEIPGGQVEEGEPLHEALIREVKEETGVLIKPVGITGIYQNLSIGVVAIVFYAEALTTEITMQPEEIQKARFVKLDETKIDELILYPTFRSRIRDAMKKQWIPYEAWEVNPFCLLQRLDQRT
ncbi:NUDIX hydrolase [Laceyella putida]|uniref:NUDIX hydrolase n=1 Tax=Laceyella putida TaxID=110101 RepID=A0ABW2RQW3_9BACL